MRPRIARLEDMAAVGDLLARSYPRLLTGFYDAALLDRAMPALVRANAALLGCGTFYVVEDGARLAGCGGWTMAMPGTGAVSPGLAHLRHFATDPDCVRQGVGRAIFTRCVADAVAQDVERLQAFAGLNAAPFYERLGLRRVGERMLALGPAAMLPVVVMEGRATREEAASESAPDN